MTHAQGLGQQLNFFTQGDTGRGVRGSIELAFSLEVSQDSHCIVRNKSLSVSKYRPPSDHCCSLLSNLGLSSLTVKDRRKCPGIWNLQRSTATRLKMRTKLLLASFENLQAYKATIVRILYCIVFRMATVRGVCPPAWPRKILLSRCISTKGARHSRR